MATEDGEYVKKLVIEANIKYCSYDSLGIVENAGSFDDQHLNSVLNLDIIKIDQIKDRKFKVVIDCVNGAASFMDHPLFDKETLEYPNDS